MRRLSITWLVIVLVLLCGCGGGIRTLPLSSTPTSGPPPQDLNIPGNWELATRSTIGMPALAIAGSIIQSGNTLSGAVHVDGSNCFEQPTAVGLTGTLRDGNVSLTSASIGGQVIALAGTISKKDGYPHGVYFQPTIGNHDYDCEADRPQPRGTSNYLHYFSPPVVNPTAYLLDSAGNRTPNFYKIMKIGSTNYMILSLELFPRSFILATANQLVSNFAGPVIVVTHAYLANDGSGPTFSSTHPVGSAYPLCSGLPSSIYGCLSDSWASYQPVGGGADGIALWYQLIGAHPNVFMALSGHIRNPSPGDYPNVPAYNGTGHVDCAVQSWSTLCSSPYRPIQVLSDFQGQGNGGYFGYGYLRILTVSPAKKTVSVFTYSPSIASSSGNFPVSIPPYKSDKYNQFTINFPNTFGGPDTEFVHITAPLDGNHVPLTFGISAAAYGPDATAHMQVYLDGQKYADYPSVSSLPRGTVVTLPGPGVHRVGIQTYDNTKAAWVKSVIYVINP